MKPIALEDILTKFRVNEDWSKWEGSQTAPEGVKAGLKPKEQTNKEDW